MKTMKKAFALLLAVVMVMGLSVTAFADSETGTGTISEITSSGVVDGDNITVSGSSLQWCEADSSIGRGSDGWWIGVEITAPDSVTADNVDSVKYSNSSTGDVNKSFATNRDGDFFINCWVLVNPDYLDTVIQNGTNIVYTYRFDWDGDGNVDQTFTITVDPSNITLVKDGEVAYQTVNGSVVIKDSALLSSTIIVEGVAGETYTAYKIFDVTISGDAYAYSIAPDSGWLSVIATRDEDTGIYTSKIDGLTLTLSADGSKYVVEVSEDFDPAEFAKTLIANASGKTVAGTGTAGSDGTAYIEGLDAGYYLVDSSLGALCILNTADVVTVVEKNSAPSIKKEVLEDDNNSTHAPITDNVWQNKDTDEEYAVLDVIDTVTYQLTVNTGTDKYTDTATGVDSDYVIDDTLPTGIAYKEGTIAVKVGDTVWAATTDYTVEWAAAKAADETAGTAATPGTLKITLLATGALKNLAEDAKIVITYDATITASDVTIGADGNTNTATLTYKNQTSTSFAQVNTYQIGNDANNDGKPDFQKVDGNQAALAGVTFVLSRDVKGTDDEGNETTTTEYAVVDTNGYLVEWSKTKVEATETSVNTSYLVTDENGGINVKGLDAGTYILTETATLEGYNLLTDTITVVIAKDGGVTYKLTSSTETPTDPSIITVVNETGTELPSTGGIGTTIFYVVGSILVIGAAVLLITKKRMNGTAE